MPSKILSQTSNLFRLYQYICGKSEVPEIYHFWCLVSLITACVEDKVWYQKFKHEQLYPNLFVMLVGPSGLGKGTALGHMMRMADASVSINKFRGRLTAAHLIDHLGKPQRDEFGQSFIAKPKLWLVMDELQNDISPNPKMIEDFVYLMTELYTASSYKIDTGTRTKGYVSIERPLINWLAGTNEEDLREIMSAKLMRSGFTARTCFIFGKYDFNKRYEEIEYPADYEEVFQYICMRLWLLQKAAGPFMVTNTAKMELSAWYKNRPNPDEELLYAAWKRNHDLLLKFSMVLCLADGGPLVINHKHTVRAQQMVNIVYRFSEKLVETASETYATRPLNEIARYIQRKKTVGHTEATRYFRSSKGMNAGQFRAAVSELINDGCVEAGVGEKGARIYYWRGN